MTPGASRLSGKSAGIVRVGTTAAVIPGTRQTPLNEQPRPGTYWVITQIIYNVQSDASAGFTATLLSGADRLDIATFTTWTGPPNQVVPRYFSPPLTIMSGSTLMIETASTAQNLNINALFLGAAFYL